jgi:hypothetical protein
MAAGYKVRLSDGSEIGPLDRPALEQWYAQGSLDRDSPVLKPGGGRWVPLSQILDLPPARRVSKPTASPELLAAARAAVQPSRAAARSREPAYEPRSDTQVWRVVLAGILLLVASVAALILVFKPERWLPTLDPTPWREIALGLAAVGLLLIRGWEAGRRIVRVLMVVTGFGAFPLAAILFVEGVRGRAYLVLASAMVLTQGFVLLLARGWLSWLRVALSLIVVVGGAVGVGWFGLVPADPQRDAIRRWVSPDRQFSDATAGVTLSIPEPWVRLKPEQPAVAAPSGTRCVVAQPRLGGFGWLQAEAGPRLPQGVDARIQAVLAKQAASGRTEVARGDSTFGALKGRHVMSTWEANGVRYRELVAVVRDGLTWWTLRAWVPDDGSRRPERELEALANGLSVRGVADTPLRAAVERAAPALPHLTRASVELTMLQSTDLRLEPPDAFRQAQVLAGRGLSALTPTEARELDTLDAAVGAGFARPDRRRLMTYLERARRGEVTDPADNSAMTAAMRGAVLRLDRAQIARLQALYEKAIRAAVGA